MTGILFNVIENLFVLDLFKDLRPGYFSLSRTTLSGRLIDEEYSRVNLVIFRDLEQLDHLTLGKYELILKTIFIILMIILTLLLIALDGWTTPKMESIYNYIVTTDTRMEYLIGL